MKQMLFMAISDAMDNGNQKMSIVKGSGVIGTEIPADRWQNEINRDMNSNYVIISGGAIFIRQIARSNGDTITCRALNTDRLLYPDFLVNLSDCTKLFKVSHRTKTRLNFLQNMTIPLR
jgi:hypothetical protein